MKQIVCICLILPVVSRAYAQPASAPLSPGTQGARELTDVAYVDNGHERQRLDLYLPKLPDGKPRPVLVRIHGGAWRHGDKSTQRSIFNYVKQGYIGVAINYRLSQHAIFPAQIQDCKAAIRWLRAHADDYGIDPDRIAVMGSSAGGHLAALLGTTGDSKQFDVGDNLEFSSAVCAVVDYFGPTDLIQAAESLQGSGQLSAVTQLLGGTVAENKDLGSAANPISYITACDPPFLIFHGDSDPLVPLAQSQILHAALRKAGVSSDFRIVKGGLHGGESFHSQTYRSILRDFLARNVMGKGANSQSMD